jgi:exodeoxyribonuclease VII small subunit
MPSDKDFESSLKELEEIVQQLEAGDLALERALELFEHGVKLSRACQKRLEEAESKVEILLRSNDGTYRPEPFEDDEEE